jgi:RecA/RadA recombinase
VAKKKVAKKTAKKSTKTAKGKAKSSVGATHDRLAEFAKKAEKGFPGTTSVAGAIADKNMRLARISTGNMGLDIATYGGLARGRIHRFYGREKSAKTGSSLNALAAWQRHCGECYERNPCEHGKVSGVDRPKAAGLWIDAEHRLHDMLYWVEGHGVDLDRLLIQSPPSGQHIVDFVDATIREFGARIGFIVIDSVANLTSQEEIDKATMKGRTAPVNALLMNKALRKWVAAINELGIAESRKPTIILINQVRHSISGFGNPEVQPGGKGMDFATSLDMRFSSGKYHYLVQDKTGAWDDKMVAFGTRWKPDEDASPDYVEINYRVTASGICPNGRFGQFNYWVRPAHGRRVGDPDNVDRMWEYARRLNLLEREGRAYRLFDLTGTTQSSIKDQLYEDATAQVKVWRTVVDRLIEAE